MIDKVRGDSCGGWRGCISLQEYREVGERYWAAPSEQEVRRVCEGVSAGRAADDNGGGGEGGEGGDDDSTAAHQLRATSPSSSAAVPPKRATGR